MCADDWVRVKDWLFGVRPAAPDKETQRSLDKEPLTEAERLRVVHKLITLPVGEGGVGITPKQGPWTLVESIFPLHDHDFNKVNFQSLKVRKRCFGAVPNLLSGMVERLVYYLDSFNRGVGEIERSIW